MYSVADFIQRELVDNIELELQISPNTDKLWSVPPLHTSNLTV